MKLKVLTAAAVVCVASCGSPGPFGTSEDIELVELGRLPPPTRADLSVDSRPYLIGPFDKLRVDVFGVEELSGEVQADASGRISVPLAGTIEAAGKTPGELADEIALRLRDGYVKDPQVSVNLMETVSQVVTVSGEVRKPGLYPVLGKMTLMRAIAQAEGSTEFADADNVVVFRTVSGQDMAAVYNLGAIRRGNYNDPEVYANDVVVVGESGTRRLFKDILQAAPAVMTPLVYVLTR
ncbi:polysaccharide biosynthesis/export family protein [Allosphingosinicella sp.]|uniref:polysaccharide biosynthesis/export family protein n=1 Tax=Allosphingosinicella sp. TaxID=2823234 RepID=UPI003D712F97